MIDDIPGQVEIEKEYFMLFTTDKNTAELTKVIRATSGANAYSIGLAWARAKDPKEQWFVTRMNTL